MQGSHGHEVSGPDIDQTTSVLGEETPLSAQTPSSTYSFVEQPGPKARDTYEHVLPQPSKAQSSPFKLDGKKAERVQSKKGGVECAELGSRPANAPVVLPPDTSVHYTSVRKEPMPKDTVSMNSFLKTKCYRRSANFRCENIFVDHLQQQKLN